MRSAILLLEAELLDRSRRGVLSLPRRGRQPRVAQAVLLRLALPLVVLLVAYVLPLLVAPHLVPSSDRPPLHIPDLTIHLASAAVFFFGLFVGAYLLYEQTLAENRLVLAYPITIRELALYRLVHAAVAALKAVYYLALPVLLGQLLLSGWPAGRTLLIVAITGLVLLTLFLGAVAIMLLLCGLLPRVGPDHLFLGVFLASAWAIVIALQIGTGPVAQFLSSVVAFAARGLLPAVFGRVLATAEISRLDVAFVFLVPLLASPILFAVLAGALEDAYLRLHRRGSLDPNPPPGAGSPARGALRPRRGYFRLDRVFRGLPPPVRALIIKDILSLGRRPHSLLRVAAVIVAMVVGCSVGRSALANPELLVLYLFPAFLIFRLFIDSAGIEAGNAHVVRLSFPNPAAYLRMRASIAAAVGLGATLLTWLVVTPWLGATDIPTTLARAVLLGLSSTLGAALVTAYSASFSTLHGTGLGQYDYSVRPAALALYWAIGPLVPGLFFLLDTGMIGSRSASIWITPAVTGLVAMAAGTALLWRLASRSLRRHLEAPCV